MAFTYSREKNQAVMTLPFRNQLFLRSPGGYNQETTSGRSSMVEWELPKLRTWVHIEGPHEDFELA